MDKNVTIISSLDLKQSMAEAKTGWGILMIVIMMRTVLAAIAQAVLTAALSLGGDRDALFSATPWWTVTGTIIDGVCLFVLYRLTKREDISIRSLTGFDRKRVWRDVLFGLVAFAAIFPVSLFLGSTSSSFILYGTWQPVLPEGAFLRQLPLWGLLYSRLVWWVVWSFTEEVTYQGYALPRLRALTGKTWLSVLIIAVFWALQHSFLPFFYNWKHFIWVFITFLPMVIILQLVYIRKGRLFPLIVTHWVMDLVSTFMITT